MKLHFKVLGRPAVELINRGMLSRNYIKQIIEQLQKDWHEHTSSQLIAIYKCAWGTK